MPPDKRNGPHRHSTGRRQGPPKASAVRIAERELIGWQLAVEHLHGVGLPAPAPQFAAAWLRRRRIYPDWEMAA